MQTARVERTTFPEEDARLLLDSFEDDDVALWLGPGRLVDEAHRAVIRGDDVPRFEGANEMGEVRILEQRMVGTELIQPGPAATERQHGYAI